MDRVHGPGSRVHGIGTHLGSSNPRSTLRILCSERVSPHLISVVRARSDGGAVGFGRWRRGRMHMVVAPSELAREGSGRRSGEGISSLSGLKWTGAERILTRGRTRRGTTPRWLAVIASLLRARSMASGGSGAPLAKARGWAASGAPTVLSRPDGGEWATSRRLGDVDGSWGSTAA
jgi:hypothetical protein